MEEGILPHKKSIVQGDDISEERRLCYVGITRAREKLFMTLCKERKIHGNMQARHISRFLNGLDAHYKKQDRTKFEHLSEEEEKEYKQNFFSGLLALLDEDDENKDKN
jgi:superfamily I DNA/RNA helicase